MASLGFCRRLADQGRRRSMPGRSPLSPEERFWSHVAIKGPDDCWLWRLAPGNHGYGSFTLRPRVYVRPSRFAWTVTKGAIPDGLNVCHRCDTPLCCNTGHLFVGTQLDNVQDMQMKGRRVDHLGEAHGMAVLTADDVRYIRARLFIGVTGSSLANRFNVSDSVISDIKHEKTWKSVK